MTDVNAGVIERMPGRVTLPLGKRIRLAKPTEDGLGVWDWDEWMTLNSPLTFDPSNKKWVLIEHKGWMGHWVEYPSFGRVLLIIDDGGKIDGQTSPELYY